uniref:Uncharacterized protein n=1 Tax=Arundo donax TaxID=35708 RepID=A0A0A9FW28_ARUDO
MIPTAIPFLLPFPLAINLAAAPQITSGPRIGWGGG